MGYHYPYEDSIAGFVTLQSGNPAPLTEYLGSLDRTEPPVLVYGETDEGFILSAAEYLTLDGSADFFPAAEDDHWHPFFGHTYALHAYVYQPNPEGVFHPTNPAISSPSRSGAKKRVTTTDPLPLW